MSAFGAVSENGWGGDVRVSECWYDAVLGAWIFNDEDDDA